MELIDWNNPNKSDIWENNVDYVMFIDENNSVSSVDIVKKKLFNSEEISPNENIFTVTGCIFNKTDYSNAKNEFDKLRKKYWNNGMYHNPKKNRYEQVCFHSEDIRGRKKAFHKDVITDDKYHEFITELDSTLAKLKYKIVSINIDIKSYLINSRYTEMNIYKIAFNFIIERFIYNMIKYSTGTIIFEARGKKEDKILLEHINKIINETGTEFLKSSSLKEKINGVYFNKKKNSNGHPYAGLEIADLSSYPIHRYVKFGTEGRDYKTIKSKLASYPNYIGRGLKIYPKK